METSQNTCQNASQNTGNSKRKKYERPHDAHRNRKKAKAREAVMSHCENINCRIENRRSEHRRKITINPLFKAALLGALVNSSVEAHNTGPMNVQCRRGCGAMHFLDEKTQFVCCDKQGHGSHEFLAELPPFIDTLLQDPIFRKNIRHYNCTFQIATLGSTLGTEAFNVSTKFPFNIRVHGALYHSIPPVVPKSNENARFAQLYVIDNALEHIMRNQSNGLDQRIVELLLSYIRDNNPWAKAINKHVRTFLVGKTDTKMVQLNIEQGEGQFTAPTVDEIAGFVPNGSTEFDAHRSVRLTNRNGTFSCINELNPFYDPAHYVIMFPKGDTGYNINMRTSDDRTTALKFYQQRMQVRPGKTLGRFGRLFHEYAIDQFCKVEKQNLDYIRTHQKDLRASTGSDDRPEEVPVGRNEGASFVYLPPSFVGGQRYFRRKYLDALNAVNQLGATSLFITMTTNPNWPEIKQALAEHETPQDRPDIVARVFKMKFDSLLNDLLKNGVLGSCIGHLAVAEFQKRGLPHGHLLLILEPADRPRTPNDVDTLVQAEMPNSHSDKQMFDLVTKHMLHGPCTSYCSNAGESCRFHYPQPFLQETSWDGESMIKYRRRNNGRQFVGRNGNIFTNQHVVPYNRWLLQKYQCHLNVLVCTTKIASVRYLFRYTTKGADMATVRMSLEGGDDELATYLSGRYISAPEAVWRLFSFGLVEVSPPTLRLPVHLPGKQFRIIGQVGRARNKKGKDKKSELEGFFDLNLRRSQMEPPDIYELKYTEVSHYYVWKKEDTKWDERKNLDGSTYGFMLNRMDNVAIKQGERYYLRLLLQQATNPKSFEELRTVGGVLFNTFQDACREMGLLTDDQTWHNTIQEATIVHTPPIARHIFAQVLAYGDVQDPASLFRDHLDALAEDFRRVHDEPGTTPDMQKKVVAAIELYLNEMGRSLSDYAPLQHLLEAHSNGAQRSIVDKKVYNSEEKDHFRNLYESYYLQMNQGQHEAMNKLVDAYENDRQARRFLVMAAAGTGKTFVQNAFIEYIKWKVGTNTSFIAMSTTAISAQILQEGHTAHSTLKFPIQINNGLVRCAIQFDSPLAAQLREAKVVIWDEIFGARKELIEAADVFFQELHDNSDPFGGLLVVFSGDLRQTLPKLQHGKRGDIANLCFTRSKCFPSFKILKLDENMRLNKSGYGGFADYLLRTGNGSQASDGGLVTIPGYLKMSKNSADLFEFVYGDDVNRLTAAQLSNCAILAPLNASVRDLNSMALDQLTSQSKLYLSTDEELDEEGNVISDLPPEVLNNMYRPGLPVHNLKLKVKALVMCMRNMSRDVCNGTKLQVQKLHKNLIDCLILTGPARGNTISLPRIILTDNRSPDTVILRRKQFPISLAYAMTIDKSQGQSLQRVGVALDTPCFAHGQFYTALSRAHDPLSLALYVPQGDISGRRAKNVVWKEVFPPNF